MEKEQKQEKIKELIEKNNALTKALTSFKRQIGGYKTSNTNLRNEVKNLTNKIVQLQEKYKACVEERNKLAADLAKAENNIYNLKNRVKELEGKWWHKLWPI